jgi:hypothetical protein
VRRIAEGEEIIVSYTQLLAPREARQAALRAGFLFDCECSLCRISTTDAIVASNGRRALLAQMESAHQSLGFATWLRRRDITPDTFIGVHRKALELAELEGLESYANVAQHTDAIMRTYGAIGDRVRFLDWAEKAKAAWLVEYGSARNEWRPRVEDILTWLDRPESFEHWSILRLYA